MEHGARLETGQIQDRADAAVVLDPVAAGIADQDVDQTPLDAFQI